ncbi:proline-rich receptor-like protein kinase PERK2 [Teleopsis dalmanni]|uniref:proline-rich receptor-like protein kinase PERK2 n=1 Tax=Teleopsis dalmanni TaxID=139649 RepID=UPI0018CFA7F0|nr:proline-rich receptor-like protein kinase PERK2 [Teleopsis dalmanni]
MAETNSEIDPLDPLVIYKEVDMHSTVSSMKAKTNYRSQRSPQVLVLNPGVPQVPIGGPIRPIQPIPQVPPPIRPIPIQPIQPIQTIRPLQPVYPLAAPPVVTGSPGSRRVVFSYPNRPRGNTRIVIKPVVILPVGTGYLPNTNLGIPYSYYGTPGIYPYPTIGPNIVYPTYATTTQRPNIPNYNYNYYNDYGNNYQNYGNYNYGDYNYGNYNYDNNYNNYNNYNYYG